MLGALVRLVVPDVAGAASIRAGWAVIGVTPAEARYWLMRSSASDSLAGGAGAGEPSSWASVAMGTRARSSDANIVVRRWRLGGLAAE